LTTIKSDEDEMMYQKGQAFDAEDCGKRRASWMKREYGSLGAAAIALAAPASAFAQSQQDFDRYGWGPHMMGWGGLLLGPLFMIFGLVLTIAVIMLLLRWISGSGHHIDRILHPGAGSRAVDILKERYARGEIDKQEFDERRRTLGE
jgi:putative membrane protein